MKKFHVYSIAIIGTAIIQDLKIIGKNSNYNLSRNLKNRFR